MTTTLPPSSTSPPPLAQVGAIAWARKNLFSGWFNSLLTIVIGAILLNTIIGFVRWSTTIAKWQVIPANLPLYFTGRFPANQYWRLWLVLGVLAFMAGLTWGLLNRNTAKLFTRPVLMSVGVIALIAVLTPTPIPYRLLVIAVEVALLAGGWIGWQLGNKVPDSGKWLSLAWTLSFFLILWLMVGGLGLPKVETSAWGGLLLTMFMSIISIILCFPFGILLALGRQSSLPVIRWLSTIYVEVVRGVPLISILFIGSVMIPLFLPGNIRPDLVLRAIIGLTLFSAAYLAENIRGGLQAIPRGQSEASSALGLSAPLTIGLIVLPQALKIAIPSIVGQFISLLQDTTLVSIIGLFDLLGISRAILANPNFIGRYSEVYLFIGLIYWVICYAMSLGSRRLEESFRTNH